jgi:hypothetical protein
MAETSRDREVHTREVKPRPSPPPLPLLSLCCLEKVIAPQRDRQTVATVSTTGNGGGGEKKVRQQRAPPTAFFFFFPPLSILLFFFFSLRITANLISAQSI